MVSSMLNPMRVRSKGDPIAYVATMTWGVSQGAPSLPVLFNIYIDALAITAESTEELRRRDGAIIMLADDVLLKARTHRGLQELADIATVYDHGLKAPAAIHLYRVKRKFAARKMERRGYSLHESYICAYSLCAC